jgi:tetratricopeptide (TPR) repeat protein
MAISTGAAILLWTGAGHAAGRCEPGIARVASLQGQVEVKRGEAGAWTVAVLDEELCIGDYIRVGALARAALALANDSVFSIDQLTTMRIGAPAETGRSLLQLLVGAVHFFSHRPRVLEIDTPIASAGTEGTEFLMRVEPDRTEVLMFEGRVRLRTPEGELLVASGDAAVATRGAAPRPEIVARPRDAVAWSLYYPPILAPLAERRAPPDGLPQGLQTAILRVAANDYAGAIAALDAVPEAARDARYYTYRAGVLLNVGRVDEAAQAIDRALAQDPKAADALAQRAVIAVVQNRRADALSDARRAVELNPDSAPARIALSYAEQASFDLEAARATLQEAAKRAPDDALVWARLSEIELSFGNLNAAQTAADRAVALAPDLERTQMVLGFAALTRIDIDAARAAFERAIELDSAEPLARLGLGLARIRAGHLEAGRKDLEIAAALDPNNSLLRSYLGKAYFEEKRDPQDAQQYEIAKQLDPNDPTPWLYDAIRLQTINRPVEALHNIEKSIELNDNRAPYRSRLLLDEDLAVRQTSLARIYNNLGFEQLGLNEATKSLTLDPANYSAHRFLSDTYAGIPRLEIARASELLQSQLLQPININPVQPTLPITDLNTIAAAGATAVGFNEFGPLFERNRVQPTLSGLIGNHDTIADEIVLNGLYNRVSVSAGQFHSDTNGFRKNNEVDNDLYDVFGQFAATPKFSAQAEYRRRETDQGDLIFDFDPDLVAENFHRALNQDTVRLGTHLAPLPNVDLITSLFQIDRHEKFGPSDYVNDQGYQAEAQAILRSSAANSILGGGHYDIDVDDNLPTRADPNIRFSRRQENVYFYNYFTLPYNFIATIGMSYDDFEENHNEITKVNPKLGLEWSPTESLRVRLAAFRVVKRALAADQTIEPTQVAGFNQFFDDFNGATAWRYGAGLDARIASGLYGGVEASAREVDEPVFGETENRDEQLYRIYLYWTPRPRWAINSGIELDRFQNPQPVNEEFPKKVDTLSIPVAIRYFDPSGIFAELGVTYVADNVDRIDAAGLPEGDDQFWLLDATVGYRLPRRYGILSLEGKNLLGESFGYEDDNYRIAEPRNSRYIPDRTILARLTLSF